MFAATESECYALKHLDVLAWLLAAADEDDELTADAVVAARQNISPIP